MSKYIIEIEDTPFTTPFTDMALYKAKNFKSLVFDEVGLSKLEKLEPEALNLSPDKTYDDGLLAAWETARKIGSFESDDSFTGQELLKIFGKHSYGVFSDYVGVSGVKEVMRRIREYEDNHKKEKERVNELAEEIGINKLYSIVKELRGE